MPQKNNYLWHERPSLHLPNHVIHQARNQSRLAWLDNMPWWADKKSLPYTEIELDSNLSLYKIINGRTRINVDKEKKKDARDN